MVILIGARSRLRVSTVSAQYECSTTGALATSAGSSAPIDDAARSVSVLHVRRGARLSQLIVLIAGYGFIAPVLPVWMLLRTARPSELVHENRDDRAADRRGNRRQS